MNSSFEQKKSQSVDKKVFNFEEPELFDKAGECVSKEHAEQDTMNTLLHTDLVKLRHFGITLEMCLYKQF